MTKTNMFSKHAKLLYIVILTALLITGGLIILLTSGNDKDEKEIVNISGLIAAKTEDDLFKQSSLIILGTVTDVSESFKIRSTSGSTANFTDYNVKIENVYRGSCDDKIVTVRTQGGTVGKVTEIYKPSPKLEKNKKYLLFLYQPGRGGAFNTEGTYFYILGLTQGIFTAENEEFFLSQNGTQITKETLISCSKANPVNVNYFREEYIENQKRNLENGFISRKEYDMFMEKIDVYATIVE